jgi:Tol biopolymer transport system component
MTGDVSGGGVRRLTVNNMDDWGPTWSPDGR